MTKQLLITPQNPNGIVVDLTAEEEAQFQTDIANANTERQARETAKATAEANKTSAISKLSALGLSEDEINALIK